MKLVKDMGFRELVEEVNFYSHRFPHLALVADRLYELHDLTRWVPVSERMPTEEDGLNLSDGLCVLVKSAEIPSWHRIVPYSRANSLNGYSHWRRITPPEDKL
jgi:hypothetical protein